jgi:membrane protease YdiL (CAAX protease family)
VESLAASPSAGQGRRVLALLGALAALGGVIVGGQQLGGEGRELAQQGVLAGPALALAGLLQLARVWGWLRPVAWIWFWLMLLALGGMSLLLTGSAIALPSEGAGTPEQGLKLLTAFVLVGLAYFLAVTLAASGAWYGLARAFRAEVDRRESAHAQGLIVLLFGIAVAAVPLIVLGGRAPLLLLIERDASWLGNRSDLGQILDLYYSLVWTIPLAFLAVGLPVRRTLAQTLDRLGLRPLGRRDVLIVVAIAVALVFAANELDELLSRLWEAAGWPRTDAKLVERLFGATVSPVGAVSVAISAGVGEELIARGLFQPRFGWLLPNLAFAMAHAFQYGPDSVVSVFLTGAVLAAVRARWNTTASALTHGLYDFILVFASTVDLPGF